MLADLAIRRERPDQPDQPDQPDEMAVNDGGCARLAPCAGCTNDGLPRFMAWSL